MLRSMNKVRENGKSMGRIHILLGKAGAGKTNLLCHMARHFNADGQPAVLISARTGITETTPIATLIAHRLFGRSVTDPAVSSRLCWPYCPDSTPN